MDFLFQKYLEIDFEIYFGKKLFKQNSKNFNNQKNFYFFAKYHDIKNREKEIWIAININGNQISAD